MQHDPISDLRRYAAALEAQVSGERSHEAARSALHTPSPARSPRRAVVAIATTVVMGISNVALAAAADPAVPGDALYGLDRAYEQVGSIFGFSDVNAGERASEFLILQARGKSAEALDLLLETLPKLLEADDPQEAVREFTEGLGNGEGVSSEIQALLLAAGAVETRGEIVSDLARALVDRLDLDLPDPAQGQPGGPDVPGSAKDKEPPTPPTQPDNPGQGNPGSRPGQSGD